MRRRMLFVAATVGVGAALALPGVSGAQIPTQDSVEGSGQVLATSFSVSVQSGPSGENPTGTLVLSGFLPVAGTATPTCMGVSGDIAVVAFVFVDGPNVGRFFIAEIQDNGPPVSGQSVDVVTYAGFLFTGPLTTCPAPGAGPPEGFTPVPVGPLLSGDVTVTDAPPLPSSREQCKDDGWRDFGVFKNHGDCVSFVETGGKNPPDGP